MKTERLCIYNNQDSVEITLTLTELSHAAEADISFIQILIENHLLIPIGNSRENWRFDAAALKRARRAASFHRDLEVDFPGIALALDLMDRIDDLEMQLRFLDDLSEK